VRERRPVRRRSPRVAGQAALLGLGLLGAALSLALSYDGRGRVVTVDPARATLTVDHEPIPGLLGATRSRFPVAAPALLESVRAGDPVRFVLTASEGSHGLLTVTSLAAEPAGGPAWPWLVLALVLALLLGAVVVGVGVVLWRQILALQRRVLALDHEAGIQRRLIGETQDGVRQFAHALDQIATTLLTGYVQDLQRRLAAGIPAARSPGEEAAPLVVVQRGRGEIFRAAEGGAGASRVRVIWDRRREERRSGRRVVTHERRHAERRAAPPDTWTRLGFMVVDAGARVPAAPDGDRLGGPLRAVGGERGPAR
jgi:Cu/Ag efflux protein CusF